MPTTTEYESIRNLLRPEYAEWSDKRIEAAFEKMGMDAEAAEGFLSDFGKVVKKVAPSVLPVAGAVAGTFIGGPLGASVGGQLGSLAGRAIGGGSAPAAGGGAGSLLGGLGSAVGGGGLGSLLGGLGGSSAAGQLLKTVTNPSTLQAVGSMALGGLGKPNISVGGTSVPVGAFSNLLKVLAGRMEAEYEAALSARGGVPEYMRTYAGEAKGDPAVAEHRAEALYELLEATESEQESEVAEASEFERYQMEMEALQAEYDAIELQELYESEEY